MKYVGRQMTSVLSTANTILSKVGPLVVFLIIYYAIFELHLCYFSLTWV